MKKARIENACIYCGKKTDNFPLYVCKSCTKLWNENYQKFMPINKNYQKLINECETYIKQVMTGHSCGQEAGGDAEHFCSSDCFGCFPDTTQHYRNAAEMVVAWTMNWIEENIMKNLLLKDAKRLRVEAESK